jgi:hypothetical protein
MLASSLAIHLLCLIGASQNAPGPLSPEAKAVAFLSREVPRWSREKHCFSCHNNGDAGRALFQAAREGQHVPEDALADTTAWLKKPLAWDHNGGEGPFSDKRLARVAFTATLATAVSTDWIKDKKALLQAADRLVLEQSADGSWRIEGEDATGSPATYGRPLATFLARESLATAEPARFRAAIDRADAWLLKREVHTVTDASVKLLASSVTTRLPTSPWLDRCFDLLARAQDKDGGWGPDAFSPPEPFDTALCLLALSRFEPTDRLKGMIARGRKFLIVDQLDDGSWTETTRPPGSLSYAERISTTGWATMALLATAGRREPKGTDSKR